MLVLTHLALLLPARAAERFLQRSWLSDDGLPGNFVRSVVQARDRYLWVATSEGVVRFDGVRFTVPGGIVDREIAHMRPKMLFPFPDGTMWIATEAGGLIRWKARTWSVIWPVTTPPGTVKVTQVMAEAAGSALIVRAQEVWRARGTNPPELLSPVPAAIAARLAEDHEGNLWVALDAGGLRCLRERRVEMLDQDTRQSASTCILKDRAGVIWIGNRNGEGWTVWSGAKSQR